MYGCFERPLYETIIPHNSNNKDVDSRDNNKNSWSSNNERSGRNGAVVFMI